MWIHCNEKTVDAITHSATSKDAEVNVEVIRGDDGLVSLQISRDYGEQGWSVDVPRGCWFRLAEDGQPEVRRTTPAELVDMQLDRAESLEQAIALCGGAFSMCWDNMYSGKANAGVFEDERANAIVKQLRAYIEANYIPKGAFTVELGGQVFTQAQWEAMLVWRDDTKMARDMTIAEKLEYIGPGTVDHPQPYGNIAVNPYGSQGQTQGAPYIRPRPVRDNPQA